MKKKTQIPNNTKDIKQSQRTKVKIKSQKSKIKKLQIPKTSPKKKREKGKRGRFSEFGVFLLMIFDF